MANRLNIPPPEPQAAPPRPPRKRGPLVVYVLRPLVRTIRMMMRVDAGPGSWMGWVQTNWRFAILATAVALGYVYIAHYAERKAREVARLELEIKDLHNEMTTRNAELSTFRRQTEIARLADTLGLQPLKQPPYQLVISREEMEKGEDK